MKKWTLHLRLLALLCSLTIVVASCTSEDSLQEQLIKKYEGYVIEKIKVDSENAVQQAYIINNQQLEEYICFVVEEKGYEDMIQALVVIDTQKEIITEIEILDEKESIGYGEYVTESWFLNRFQGIATKETIEVVKMKAENPNEIVAITGATITSKGVVKAVNDCLVYYEEMKGD
ncbi:FMN-binding protein [Vallitalea okinawensis]|uniref:FMN-binding protein n=1 Tax=Vallitalea okinawensis TaxID=2078660 RepID=UPI000CFC4841|nr:FMN-binding protein [Vallitalea okinawensis]